MKKHIKYLKALICLMCISVWSIAQTTGPTQPEATGFQAIGSNDMVNLYSGDFNYNIPLMVVPGPDGGYPINLFYNSNVGMEQAASWVGLGWNLNCGAIQRTLRGLPDDFKGDVIAKHFYMKPSRTIALGLAPPGSKIEIFGADLGLGQNYSIYYNNYSGLGIRAGLSLAPWHEENADAEQSKGLSLAGSFSFDSQEGVSLSPSISFSKNQKKSNEKFDKGLIKTTALGATFNSKQGFSDLNLKYSNVSEKTYKGKNSLGEMVTIGKSSFSHGSGIAFASASPIGSISMPRTSQNYSFSFSATKKSTLPVFFHNKKLNANYSVSKIKNPYKETLAYGAMYMQERDTTIANTVVDFYRENNGALTKDKVITPIPVLTYDIFTIQGHGIGGSFRAYQNSVGKLSGETIKSHGHSGSLGLELGVGTAQKVGADAGYAYSKSYSGPWKKKNRFQKNLKKYEFRSKEKDKPLFEPFYFKMIGEPSNITRTTWAGVEEDDPIAFDIRQNWDIFSSKVRALNSHNHQTGFLNIEPYPIRRPRTSSIEYFTKREMDYTTPHIVRGNQLVSINYNKGEDHHLNAISVLKPNGVRYNYDLPAYNHSEEKVTFAIPEQNTNSKIIGIRPGWDQPNNGQGEDEFYSREIMPSYAHTFFITSILSQDYVDINNDGPSENDLGSYVKFNYIEIKDYEWRFPFDGAHYAPGYLSNPNDDKASYQKGLKDLYYVKSIETKTHVAVFETEKSLLKGSNNVKQHQLKSITLYSKSDPNYQKDFYLQSAPSSTYPTPIQTVHLGLDYNLRSLTPNSLAPQQKTLALDSLWFTYNNSTKGENSKYLFNYGNDQAYAVQQQDRWGAFQDDIPSDNINLLENPYTYQDRNYSNRDQEAEAWLLNEITLPSKGLIKVDYEKDDYQYVQDKQAMNFVKVIGTGDRVYSNTSQIRSQTKKDDLYIYFDSPFSLNNDDDVYQQIKGIDHLRFRVFMELKKRGVAPYDLTKDYVAGYAEIDFSDYGKLNADVGYFKIKKIRPRNTSAFQVHPFRFAAIQYIKASRPDLLNKYKLDGSTDPTTFAVRNTVSMINELGVLLSGYYTMAIAKGWAASLGSGRPSFVRLNAVEKKYGGGSRVKSLSLHSNDPVDPVYGQTYQYTLKDGSSSGVAEFEPILGIEENPFTQPVWYNANNDGHKVIFSNEQSFHEEPLGAGLYPGASVGYGRVTVRNLENSNVTFAQSGINITEYFTAKDFPTKFESYGAMLQEYPVTIPIPFIGMQSFNNNGYSMGYAFTLNNAIYGRQKTVATYPYSAGEPTGAPIQKSVYNYKVNSKNKKELNNEVVALKKEGIKENIILGKEVDFYIDEIENHTLTVSGGLAANIDIQTPVFVPTAFPTIQLNEGNTRLLTTNKVIFNIPVLESVDEYKDGAKVTTSNLFYDYETGDPIITSMTNEWDEPVYTYNFPAHWSYEEMKGAYKNYRAELNISSASSGVYKLNYGLTGTQIPEELLQNGDLIRFNFGSTEYYVSNLDRTTNTFRLSDRRDNDPGTLTTQKAIILKSGYKNLQSTQKGRVVSLKDLSNYSPGPNMESLTVLHADATEFKEEWPLNYKELEDESLLLNGTTTTMSAIASGSTNANPYAFGLKGVWRPWRTSAYLIDRKQSGIRGDQTRIDIDGEYEVFYWYDWTKHQLSTPDLDYNEGFNWRWVNEVTKYNVNGNSKEGRNRLDIHAASLFGYKNHLVTASASNSKTTDIAFDGFEDYKLNASSSFNGAGHGNLNFINNNSTQAGYFFYPEGHTGNYSFNLAQGLACNTCYYKYETNLSGNGQYFTPVKEEKYNISFWTKRASNENYNRNNTIPPTKVEILSNGSVLKTFLVAFTTNPIDGWYQVEGTFRLPSTATNFELRMYMVEDENVLVDDIRIQPFNSGMETYVYDPANYRLLATLSNQNYATFYNYDEEGNLIQTKVETNRGVKTISTNRNNIKK